MRYKRAFTLVELLTVLAIITMLIGLLVPSLNMVRRIAKETKQKSQLTVIGIALNSFKKDFGDYPPSDSTPMPGIGNYCGAQKLVEALVGRDLMGFHPATNWDALDNTIYNPTSESLGLRRGLYLELTNINVIKLGALFNYPGILEPSTQVFCDTFSFKKITIGGKTVRAGTPVLYYRANTSSKTIAATELDWSKRIYDARDNQAVIIAKDMDADEDINDQPLSAIIDGDYQNFYRYIKDLRIDSPWPYRPDSYLLITAGADGLYGTADDICNFGI